MWVLGDRITQTPRRQRSAGRPEPALGWQRTLSYEASPGRWRGRRVKDGSLGWLEVAMALPSFCTCPRAHPSMPYFP